MTSDIFNSYLVRALVNNNDNDNSNSKTCSSFEDLERDVGCAKLRRHCKNAGVK